MAGLGSPPASALAVVQQAWAELVGPAAGAALTPVGIRDGALIVVADDPAWVGQARWFEGAVVEGLAPLLGPGVVTSMRAKNSARKTSSDPAHVLRPHPPP
jgi:hypothetical protein